MEPSVFNIVIKRNKLKYGATSTVTMTTYKQYIILSWKIPMQQSNRPYSKVKNSTRAKMAVIFSIPVYG
jgi:hypothetical protein